MIVSFCIQKKLQNMGKYVLYVTKHWGNSNCVGCLLEHDSANFLYLLKIKIIQQPYVSELHLFCLLNIVDEFVFDIKDY